MAVTVQRRAGDEQISGVPGFWFARSTWIRPHVLVPAVGLLVFLVLIIGGYRLGWQWTGFSDNTLWDWLQLLILPVVLATGGFLFNLQQNRNAREATTRQHELDMQLADNQQQEAALDAYLDKMAELLLDRKLRESAVGAGVREVAHARTVATVWRVGKHRKGVLLKFLFDSRLIDRSMPVISLAGADLSHAQISGVDLHGADLREVILTHADLRGANLSGASLRGADLTGALLTGADTTDAEFTDAQISHMVSDRLATRGAK